MNRLLEIMFLLLFISACDILSNQKDDNEGKDLKKIRPVPPTYQFPSVGPEGKTIVFYRRKVLDYSYTENMGDVRYTVDPDSTGLYVMKANGSEMKLLLKGVNFNYPEISPNGQWLLFGQGDLSNSHIYKVPFEGDTVNPEEIIQLSQPELNINNLPRWSPNGDWIVYRNLDCGNANNPAPYGQCGLIVVRSDGSDKQFIDPAIPCNFPDWDSDNNSLVCVGAKQVVEYNIATDSSHSIKNIPADHSGYDLRYTSVSASGNIILFVNTSAYPDFDEGIYKLDRISGTLDEWIIPNATMPGWFPDKKRVVYIEDITSTIWTADYEGENRVQLTKNHGLQYEYYKQ